MCGNGNCCFILVLFILLVIIGCGCGCGRERERRCKVIVRSLFLLPHSLKNNFFVITLSVFILFNLNKDTRLLKINSLFKTLHKIILASAQQQTGSIARTVALQKLSFTKEYS